MRILDARTGSVVDLVGTTPRLVTIHVRGHGEGPLDDPAGLRAVVVADLLRRTLESQRVRVEVVHDASGPVLARLNIRPADAPVPGAHADVLVAAAGAEGPVPPGDRGAACPLVRGGPLRLVDSGAEVDTGATGRPTAAALVQEVVDHGLDPLALRLCLLEHAYAAPVALTRAAIAVADGSLRRWRGLVADWAESPSGPLPAAYVTEVSAAFGDDLDTPRALVALRRLERDDEVEPGARFEAVAHLDALLGLDLVREVGRSRATAPGTRPR